MTLDPRFLAELDAFLIGLNRAAGEVILPLFRGDHGLEDKNPTGSLDPVTEADKAAERAIRHLIGQFFPTHGVIGEEYGEDRPEAEFVWVLDPIDGTRAFVAGLPLWTTLIALRHNGDPVLGSIGQAYLDEIYIGSPLSGSRLLVRGQEMPLKTRACPELSQAIVATTDPEACFAGVGEAEAWMKLRAATRLARLGCDAYAFAQVAAGKIDIAMEGYILKPWDIDAAVPVIEGAGGFACDWTGKRVGRDGGQLLLAGDRACLDQAVEILTPAAR